MDDGFAERVRTHTDIVEIISDYVTLKQQGRDLVGLCPFHEEKTPSFTVSPERQLYYCFGCHQGGDVFNFVMQIEGLTFPEALRFLAERAGIEVPRRMREGGSSRRQRVRDYLYRLGELAAEFYRERLEDSAGAAARNYLRDRGIPESVQKEYRLGYAPGSWNAMCGMLQSRGVKMRAAELMGLVKKSEERGNYYDAFRDRLMFTITDFQGRVVGFAGRVLDDGHPKYLNSPENPIFRKGDIWYGLDRARDAIRRRNRVILVEGYMDVLACVVHRWRETVASMGTAVSSGQVALLGRYTQNAFVAFDADSAGTEAVLRSMNNFTGTGVNLRVISLPRDTDPDEVLNSEGGEETFARCVEEGVSFFDFCWNRACERHDVSGAEGKARALHDVAHIIWAEEDSVVRADRIRQVADSLNLPQRAIRDQLRQLQKMARKHKAGGNRHNTKENYGTRLSQQKSASWRAERQVLQLMLARREFVRRGIEALREDDFEDELHRRIASVVLEEDQVREDVNNRVLSSCEDEEQRRLVAEFMMEDLASGSPERVFNDCTSVLLRRRQQKRVGELMAIISGKERRGEPIPPQILQEQMQLLLELKSRKV